jgi:hypothetical protein
MITVRTDPETEAMVERLARRRGQSKSQIVREALKLLVEREKGAREGGRPYDRVKHLIGCVRSGGAARLSEDTGRKFRELLLKKVRARRSR